MSIVYFSIGVVLAVIIPFVYLFLPAYHGAEVNDRIRFWAIISQLIGDTVLLLASHRLRTKNSVQSKKNYSLFSF
jgi:hypothetical protein